MASDHEPQRTEWVGPLLVVVGAVVLIAGIATLYMSGICGFQADEAEAAACFRRWRVSGGLIAVAGAATAVLGARRIRAIRKGR